MQYKTVTRFSWRNWAVFSVVFFGMPLLLIMFYCNHVWLSHENLRVEQITQKMDFILSALESYKDPVSFMTTLLQRTDAIIRGGTLSRDAQKRLLDSLRTRFPGVFSFYFLDQNGDPIPELCDHVTSRALLKKLFTGFLAKANGNPAPLERDKRLLRGLLGSLIDPTPAICNLVRVASYRRERGFIFLSPVATSGMMLTYLNQTPDWDILGVRDRVKARRAKKSTVVVGLIDSRLRLKPQSKQFGRPGRYLEQVVNMFNSIPSDQFVVGNHIWSQRFVYPSVRLLAVTPMPDADIFEAYRSRLRLASLAVFLLLSLVALKVMDDSWQWYLSIRLKLVLLFLFSAGLPLAVMGVAAENYFSERRRVLENSIHLNTEKALRAFDNQFPQTLGNVEKDLFTAISKPVPPGESILPAITSRLEKMGTTLDPTALKLVDERGTQVFSRKSSRPAASMSAAAVKNITVNIIRSLNRDQAQVEEMKDDQLTSMTAMAGNVEVELIFANLSRTLGKIGEFRMGMARTLLYMQPIYDARGMAKYLAIIGWNRTQWETFYARKKLRIAESRLPDTRLFASHRRNRSWTVPVKFRYETLLKPFLNKMQAQAQTTFGKLFLSRETWHLTGIRGNELPEYDLIAMTSDRQIRDEIRRLWLQFGLISMGILIISLTVGALLARKFLEPVGHLDRGVSALRQRAFDTRIPILDHDELGDLSSTFNEMIEGMADLEVARIVQESLFPSSPIISHECQVYGTCLPATQVGGDYFDYFALPDGRLAIIVGDVSGHGVSAALVMGMAKALVAHPNNVFEPENILSILNRVFEKILKRKKMMTCIIAVLDSRTRHLILSNAGQNFPYLIKGNVVSQIDMPNVPLGISSRTRFTSRELVLETDQWLLFYTDGLVEALGLNGEQLGYEIFETALPGLRHGTPMETERAIREWHRRVVREGPQEDDITVVVVQ